MGIIQELIHEELISSEPDRHANLLRVYRKDNGEVVIHFRNLKINLISPQEIQEWKFGFQQALDRVLTENFLENDI